MFNSKFLVLCKNKKFLAYTGVYTGITILLLPLNALASKFCAKV